MLEQNQPTTKFYPRVLVAIPYHAAKFYSIQHAIERASELTYPNKEIVMRFDPNEYGSQDACKKQREYFRKMAIEKGFDFLYFMGADTIPPADVLERMISQYNYYPDMMRMIMNTDKKIIGGVYWGRHNANNGNPQTAVAWIHEKSKEEQTEMFKTMNKLVPVDGMGMDSVLIPREALEEISFLSWPQNDDDYPFYDRAIDLGYKVILDTNIQCKHYFNKNGYVYLAEVTQK